jgi:glyoxalase/bleomycin resistance protein/dioxygenase superfamily protein
MGGAPFYHVGILVADLDEAMERFSQKLGITFCEPNAMQVTLADPEPFECEMRATYSREGPPHIELVQGYGDGLFSLRHGEGIHHLGLWAPDWTTYNTLEPTHCLPVAVQVRMMPGDPTMWLSDPADLHGTRLEYVDTAMQPSLEGWIKGVPPQ